MFFWNSLPFSTLSSRKVLGGGGRASWEELESNSLSTHSMLYLQLSGHEFEQTLGDGDRGAWCAAEKDHGAQKGEVTRSQELALTTASKPSMREEFSRPASPLPTSPHPAGHPPHFLPTPCSGRPAALLASLVTRPSFPLQPVLPTVLPWWGCAVVCFSYLYSSINLVKGPKMIIWFSVLLFSLWTAIKSIFQAGGKYVYQ